MHQFYYTRMPHHNYHKYERNAPCTWTGGPLSSHHYCCQYQSAPLPFMVPPDRHHTRPARSPHTTTYFYQAQAIPWYSSTYMKIFTSPVPCTPHHSGVSYTVTFFVPQFHLRFIFSAATTTGTTAVRFSYYTHHQTGIMLYWYLQTEHVYRISYLFSDDEHHRRLRGSQTELKRDVVLDRPTPSVFPAVRGLLPHSQSMRVGPVHSIQSIQSTELLMKHFHAPPPPTRTTKT